MDILFQSSTMKSALSVIAVASLFVSASAFAQKNGDVYGEFSYARATMKDESTNNLGTFKPSAGRFTLGTVVSNNIALEGFVQQGLSASSHAVGNNNIELKLKTGYGLAVRPFINVTDSIELYGRIGSVRNGYSATVTASNGASASESDKTTNTMYGGGLAYKLNNKAALVFDYSKLNKKDDTAVSIVSVGVRFGF